MLVLNASGDTTRPTHLPPPTMKDRTTQSDPWGHGIDVKRLADRLDELADYVTQGADCVRRNFVMRVPAEPYHDADLVISTAARLLRDGLVTPPSSAKPAANPVNLAELHDPGFSDGLTASQHLDVLRGGPDPRADQTEGPSLDDVAELCKEFGFVPGNNGALLAADVFRAPPFTPLPMLRDMITAAITRWRAPVTQPAAQPVEGEVNLELMAALIEIQRLRDLCQTLTTTPAPEEPEAERVLRLAQILEEVDGRYDTYPEDAEAILAHPGFSGCHDGPVGVQSALADLLSQVKSCDGTAQIDTEKAEQALADWNQRSAWQPIETAPRDGADFIAYNEFTGPYITAAKSISPIAAPPDGTIRFPMHYWHGQKGTWFPEPTHWQPLPSPPITPSPHA